MPGSFRWLHHVPVRHSTFFPLAMRARTSTPVRANSTVRRDLLVRSDHHRSNAHPSSSGTTGVPLRGLPHGVEGVLPIAPGSTLIKRPGCT